MLSTMLMLHFVRCLVGGTAQSPAATPPAAEFLPFLLLGAAALIVPWLVLPGGLGVSGATALTEGPLIAALWPVLLGLLLFAVLRHIGNRLPRLAEGDVLVFGERAFALLPICGNSLARLEDVLRRPAIGTVLLAVFAATMAVLLRYT